MKLAVQASIINEGVYIDKSGLEQELIKRKIEITKSENEELPWTVKKDGYVYTISANGEVTEKEGIAITTGDIEFLKGTTEGKKVRAQILSGETEKIKWESTGNIILSATEGNEITVNINSNANAGDVATIIARVDGKTYQDSIKVKIVTEVTGITASKVTVEVNRKEKIGKVTTTPENAEGIEITKYESKDTTKVTVNSITGEITGVAVGTTKITIIGTGKLSKKQVTGEVEVEVTKQLITVTAEQIAAKPKLYYGKKVENYKASEEDTNTYRIFYVDTGNYFKDGANTIYLKADYNGSYKLSTSYDTTNTKIKTMNPLWASAGRTTWYNNEQVAAYLCSPVNSTTYTKTTLPWKSYYKQNDANVNYVIGGPSIEMYVKSYNQTHDKDSSGNDVLGCQYQTNNAPGYKYRVYGKEYFSTDSNTLDYSNTYNSMYCGKSGMVNPDSWWLASPSARGWEYAPVVYNSQATLNNSTTSLASNGLAPLVSLNSSFLVQVEL